VAGPARDRPPKLDARAAPSEPQPAPPATPEERLERARVAGISGAPGPTELRRIVERIAAGDRAALGALSPIERVTTAELWAVLEEIFGATEARSQIDAGRVLEGARRAVRRIREVGSTGARVAVATAAPASLLAVHQAFTHLAREAGAGVAVFDDVGPFRADGRAGRFVRSLDGVAVTTDGQALLPSQDAIAAREWLFVLDRPALVVADGPFAEVAWDAGIEVVVAGGLDRAALAVAAARRQRCTFLPMRVDRPPAAYAPIVDVVTDARQSPHPTEL
jgi:hypothetical protein